jgi:hypothetical protein
MDRAGMDINPLFPFVICELHKISIIGAIAAKVGIGPLPLLPTLLAIL